MTKEDALFFAEMWLSDKCNRHNKIMYQFMTIAFNALKRECDQNKANEED